MMKWFKFRNLFIFCFLLLVSFSRVTGQNLKLCPPSTSKKAVKYLDEAKKARKDKKDYKEVRKILESSIKEDSTYAEAWLELGNIAYMKKDFPVMKTGYQKLIEVCPDASSEAYYRMGTYLFETKKYTEATVYLKGFLEFGTDNEKKNKEAELLLFRANLIAHPVPFNPKPVSGISTADPEYLPVISPDNDLFFFTRRYDEHSKGALTPMSVEKFMMSKRKPDGTFETGDPMPLPFNQNSSNNEGASTISKDNRLLILTINNKGNFDLYSSELVKGQWSLPKNLGPNVNDPKQWDSQPSLSADGKTLYFATYRDSVYGTSDLYKTTLTPTGWSPAVPLSVNTNGNEKTPFIHPDNTTLYFSSDSLPGMGGLDIFMCKRTPGGSWSKPINLGYPINTDADEVGFFVSTDGKYGYYASNQLSGSGGYDIYSFEMPNDKKPEKVLFVKGQLNGEKGEEIPLAAKIELRNIATQEVIDVDYDSTTGKYASVVLFNEDYIMTVRKEGYAYNSEYFSASDTTISGVVTSNMEFKEMEVGEAYKLNDILFDTNSSELTPESKLVIADFASFLKNNPKVSVAIHGHTDNQGDPAANKLLSNNRAKAVFDHLITLGIATSRLSYKGFGQDVPVESNDKAEGRAKNRRTEFVIVSK